MATGQGEGNVGKGRGEVGGVVVVGTGEVD